MRLMEFAKVFPDEESCIKRFRALKEKRGFHCPNCGHVAFRWLPGRHAHECIHCGRRVALKSGTMLENSKLSFYDWFLALHLMTATKIPLSVSEIQRQIGSKYYQPVWEMCHKIKNLMGNMDNRHKLKGRLEVDEAFFTTGRPKELGDRKMKRGAGSERKSKVLMIVQSEDTKKVPKRGQKGRVPCYIRMRHISDTKQSTLDREIVRNVDKSSTIVTDAATAHNNFSKYCKEHIAQVIKPEEMELVLTWLHTFISNAKGYISAIHKGVTDKYLQKYLDYMAFKWNRQYENKDPFFSLLGYSVNNRSDFMSIKYPYARNYGLFNFG